MLPPNIRGVCRKKHIYINKGKVESWCLRCRCKWLHLLIEEQANDCGTRGTDNHHQKFKKLLARKCARRRRPREGYQTLASRDFRWQQDWLGYSH